MLRLHNEIGEVYPAQAVRGEVVATGAVLRGKAKVTMAAEIFAKSPRNEPLTAMAEIIDFRMFDWRKSAATIKQLRLDGVDPEVIDLAEKTHARVEEAALDSLKAAIPYCRPKLAAVAVAGEVEHRFVLIAPATRTDSKAWLVDVEKFIEESGDA